MSKQTQQKQAAAVLCPYSVGLFMDKFKAALDTVSTNQEKAARSRAFLDEIKKTAVLAESRYNELKSAKTSDRGYAKKLEAAQKEFLYTSRLDAIANTYVNRFGSIQASWHNDVNRVEAKYSYQKKNGSSVKTLTDIGVAALTAFFADASGVLEKFKNLFAVKMPHFLSLHINQADEGMMKLGVVAIAAAGIFAVVRLVKFAKRLYESRIERKEREAIAGLFMEEGPVTRAIEQIVQQRVLGLCAKYGYVSELKDYDDDKLLELSREGDLSKIRDLIISRVNEIKMNVLPLYRQLLGGPHLLPDYLEMVRKEKEEAPEASGKSSSDLMSKIFDAIMKVRMPASKP